MECASWLALWFGRAGSAAREASFALGKRQQALLNPLKWVLGQVGICACIQA